jgi:prepilin signal peptidase PulO-like enzyme (type II secretory pathway)
MIGGSVYGLIYSGFLWFRNRDKVNGEIKKLIFESRWLFVIEGVAIILILFGFIHFLYPHIFFYFGWDMPFLLIGVLLGVFPFLFVFAKGLENVSMIREVSGLELREGDWLAEDTKVMVRVAAGSGQRAAETRVIKANWDGLSLEDIKILKGKRKVMIKEGLPFVPAFLIAFLGYVFLKDWFIGFLFGFS